MKQETTRIAKLFESLYNGEPWIDVTLARTLKKISAEEAAKKLSPKVNSIWEILNHIITWRKNVLERIHGKVISTPSNNYFTPVKDVSAAAWKATIKELEASQEQWIQALKKFKEKDFENIYPNNGLSYYEHIHGILQHDAYHLGQIKLLKKILIA